jgi:hypothetical protein
MAPAVFALPPLARGRCSPPARNTAAVTAALRGGHDDDEDEEDEEDEDEKDAEDAEEAEEEEEEDDCRVGLCFSRLLGSPVLSSEAP